MMDDDDASFRLTPLDVRRYEFGTSLRGYDKMRVDQFREQLASELERLTRQNLDLETKARNFHEQLRAFRERDKALNDALVSAQQLRGDIHDQADREAQLVLREARAEAERILEAARHDARRERSSASSSAWRRRTSARAPSTMRSPSARASRRISCASRSDCSRISARSCCAATSASFSALSRSRKARSCSWKFFALVSRSWLTLVSRSSSS